MYVKRREFLNLLAGSASAYALGGMLGCGSSPASVPQSLTTTPAPSQTGGTGLPKLPDGAKSGIDHIVVVMMENRSFDHLLGWLPGGDGMQAGLSYADVNGNMVPTWRLGSNYRGCGYSDPAHLYEDCRVAYDDGRMDGFLRAGANDQFSIGYYAEQDLPFHATLVRNFTSCSRYFSSFLGPTMPNRLFLNSGQTDRLKNEGPVPCTLPTIWDSLAAAGVSAKYYFSNYSFLSIYGNKYDSLSVNTSQFYTDAAAGTLPAVCYLEPGWSINGDDEDQHPHANILRGEHFLGRVYQAITSGPKWSSTLLVITYDECGGFFEHIPPPRVTAGNDVDTDMVNGKVLLGFRVPTVVISPWSKGSPASPRISNALYDHTSILKLIQWRWGLKPLTPRDGGADINTLAYALDFTADVTAAAPKLAMQPEPTAQAGPCP